jgi:hypothetical protein
VGEATALGLGIGRLWLRTGALQPEAKALHEREGWRQVPPYPPYDRGPVSICFAKTTGTPEPGFPAGEGIGGRL